MVLRHVVMFRFADDAIDDQRAALAAGLATMPAATGALAESGYRHGPERASVQYEIPG
ncbi:MAG TPA: hypothetical protein VF015_01260 [Acidimicrobiales bacterium]